MPHESASCAPVPLERRRQGFESPGGSGADDVRRFKLEQSGIGILNFHGNGQGKGSGREGSGTGIETLALSGPQGV